MRTLLTLLLTLAALTALHAQQDSVRRAPIVITRATQVGMGGTNVLDTYLSTEKYRGLAVAFLSDVTREHDAHDLPSRLTEWSPRARWMRQMVHHAALHRTENRAGNATEVGGSYRFRYVWQYLLLRQQWGKGTLRLAAGAGPDVQLGFLYNMRNGNNPAQALAWLNITPQVMADYYAPLGRKGRHALYVRYQWAMPMVGLRFAPHYGQSYYELFVENHYDHNIVLTWPFNAPTMTHQLTADYTLRRGLRLRAGLMADLRQARVNGLKYHEWTTQMLIGIVKCFTLTPYQP